MEINPVKVPKINITKQGVMKFSRLLSIILAFALYVLGDYITTKSSGGFITSWDYWSKLIINMVLVIMIMLTVRSMRKDKRIADSFDIRDISGQISRGFKVITIGGFSTQLDDYLKEVNEENKYQTYIRRIQKQLLKCKDKDIQRRKELNILLKQTKEEIIKLDFSYKQITISKLFTSIDGRLYSDDEFDVDTHEGEDIGRMVFMKAFLVILFGAFTGSIVMDFIFGGWSALFGTILKIFSLIVAMNSALLTADEFVEHNITTSLQRRLRILAGFVKKTPEAQLHLEIKFESDKKVENTNKT